MEEKKTGTRGSKIAIGIFFLLGSMGLFMANDQYAWNLFGTVEIPMSFLGAISAMIGGWKLVSGLREKKTKDP